MKTIIKTLVLSSLLALGAFSCNTKSSDDTFSNDEIIAGKTEKTWEATKEVDAEGDRDKLTRAEKKQKVTFWRNGDVKMGDDQEMLSGKWSYQASTLSLQFTGKDVSENFSVEELTENKMQLKAGDGTLLTMKPE